jgi:hypothetical protein
MNFVSLHNSLGLSFYITEVKIIKLQHSSKLFDELHTCTYTWYTYFYAVSHRTYSKKFDIQNTLINCPCPAMSWERGDRAYKGCSLSLHAAFRATGSCSKDLAISLSRKDIKFSWVVQMLLCLKWDANTIRLCMT